MIEFEEYNRLTSQRETSIIRRLDTVLTGYVENVLLILGIGKTKLQVFDKPIILNIGSGYTEFNDTVQCDLLPSISKLALGKAKYPDQVMNLYKFQKSFVGSAKGIYLSHVLEHIDTRKTLDVLKTCYSYLNEGGAIRILVPNYKVYVNNDFEENSPQGFKSATLSLNRLFNHWGHLFMFDTIILHGLLQEAGFAEVQSVAWGEGLMGELDLESRKFESLCLVAVKE
jgi:predicted SAM-dependent methyltransferase